MFHGVTLTALQSNSNNAFRQNQSHLAKSCLYYYLAQLPLIFKFYTSFCHFNNCKHSPIQRLLQIRNKQSLDGSGLNSGTIIYNLSNSDKCDLSVLQFLHLCTDMQYQWIYILIYSINSKCNHKVRYFAQHLEYLRIHYTLPSNQDLNGDIVLQIQMLDYSVLIFFSSITNSKILVYILPINLDQCFQLFSYIQQLIH